MSLTLVTQFHFPLISALTPMSVGKARSGALPLSEFKVHNKSVGISL